jgi:hypothetical protein
LPGEYPIEPTFGGSLVGTGTLTGVRRRRRLRSAWMMSVGMNAPDPGASGIRDDPSGPFATAPTRPHHSPRRNAIPSEAMPLPPLDFGKPSRANRKDSITDTVPPLQRRDPGGGVPAWVVAVMLGLVIVAAALGFYFGRRPH